MQQKSISIKKILSQLNISELNEMQQAFIKATQETGDLVLLSATGSGKTLAFLLPVLKNLNPELLHTQAIIITPSRELALQVEKVFKSLQSGFKVTCCYGGHLRETEERNLVEAPALIIGTPGRIADHFRRQNINPQYINTLVLDEFDKSLELGFQEEISFITSSLITLEKRFLTSATDMDIIPAFLGMDNPRKLNFLSGEIPDALAIQFVKADDNDKIQSLFNLICMLGNRPLIIFCNHREAVNRLSDLLKEKGIVNVFYHGALEQPEREAALSKFRNGSSNILVTTDLASRGLDIPHIRYIIHYHIPLNEEAFTHRNGRTARMDASGTAILILSPDEKLPSYITGEIQEIAVPVNLPIPEKPKWSTLYFSAGKKDKVNKIDIVGFLANKGHLKKEDIGLIDVSDFFSFVAIRKSKVSMVLQAIKDEKIKNKKVRISVAK
ncbi:MAG: DEAD/DEAH box helicase [Chitinophagaceae bacterium]|nr:DEAD/DEAH box helicase [Chitinophagaceae bacterium]